MWLRIITSCFLLVLIFILVLNPGTEVAMATGGCLTLPEPLLDKDSHSWFKRFEVCSTTGMQQRCCYAFLLKGCAYESLMEAKTDSYQHLKAALLKHLSPDIPMHQSSIEKTVFSPGPGYGLWEFVVIPYGLTGATVPKPAAWTW